MKARLHLALLVATMLLSTTGRADEPAAHAYTVEQAVAEALANHPALRTATAEEASADARVTEADTGALPDIGVSAQINRSTSNTVPGAFVPVQGFVPIAGPTRGKSLDSGAWQTGAALWGTWDVLSFSRQAAAVDVALATRNEASARIAARRLDVAYRAADSFLLLLEAQAAVRAANANVDRARVLLTVTRSLVDQNLRPGADAARSEAELANAQTAVARAEQTRDVRRALLAEAIGNASLQIEPNAEHLLDAVDAPPRVPSTASPEHPELRQSDAAIARATEAERLVRVEYLPRLDVVASLWARGSGIFDSPADGLAPDTANWLAGATLTWSILDIPTIRARARAASASRAAFVARRDEVSLSIAGQLASGRAVLRGAGAVAQQTPKALAAARAAEEQASARFKTGLSPVVDLADAQRVLAQAEIDDAVARLEVRRALLAVARASGDLGPFLRQSHVGGP